MLRECCVSNFYHSYISINTRKHEYRLKQMGSKTMYCIGYTIPLTPYIEGVDDVYILYPNSIAEILKKRITLN